jgi:hypothetical protein
MLLRPTPCATHHASTRLPGDPVLEAEPSSRGSWGIPVRLLRLSFSRRLTSDAWDRLRTLTLRRNSGTLARPSSGLIAAPRASSSSRIRSFLLLFATSLSESYPLTANDPFILLIKCNPLKASLLFTRNSLLSAFAYSFLFTANSSHIGPIYIYLFFTIPRILLLLLFFFV